MLLLCSALGSLKPQNYPVLPLRCSRAARLTTLHYLLRETSKAGEWQGRAAGPAGLGIPCPAQPKVGRLLGELPVEAEPCRRMQLENAGACSILRCGTALHRGGSSSLRGSVLGESK